MFSVTHLVKHGDKYTIDNLCSLVKCTNVKLQHFCSDLSHYSLPWKSCLTAVVTIHCHCLEMNVYIMLSFFVLALYAVWQKKGSQTGFIRHQGWVNDDRTLFLDVWPVTKVENVFALYSMNWIKKRCMKQSIRGRLSLTYVDFHIQASDAGFAALFVSSIVSYCFFKIVDLYGLNCVILFYENWDSQ